MAVLSSYFKAPPPMVSGMIKGNGTASSGAPTSTSSEDDSEEEEDDDCDTCSGAARAGKISGVGGATTKLVPSMVCDSDKFMRDMDL